MSSPYPSTRRLLAHLTLLVAACSGDPATANDSAAAAVIVTGNAQVGEAGSALATPLSVRVTASDGRAVPRATVTFAVTGGGGSVRDASVTTDAQGTASTFWTLGVRTGEDHAVTATVAGSTGPSVRFVATATPARYRITKVAGDRQAGRVRDTLPTPLTVEVRDVAGDVVPGIAVNWTTGGDSTKTPWGTFSTPGYTLSPSAVSVTDASGRATASYTLPRAAMVTAVNATVAQANGNSVRFDAEAIAAPPQQILVAANLATVVFDGGRITDSIQLVDIFGEPAAGVLVRWEMYDEAGLIVPTDLRTTDAGVAINSRAIVGVTAGTILKTRVSVPGQALDPVILTRVVRPRPLLRIVSGDNQVLVPGLTWSLPAPVVVSLTDSSGTPVPGVTIEWLLRDNSWYWGAVLRRATTNAEGLAIATLGFQDAFSEVHAGLADLANLTVGFVFTLPPK